MTPLPYRSSQKSKDFDKWAKSFAKDSSIAQSAFFKSLYTEATISESSTDVESTIYVGGRTKRRKRTSTIGLDRNNEVVTQDVIVTHSISERNLRICVPGTLYAIV